MITEKIKKEEQFSPVNIEERQKINITSGDTVRIWQKIQEKGKTRLQPFEGIVLACKHGHEEGATFTVRRTSGGVGVEKIFPLYSPMIDRIEVVKRAKVRRSKLYHIRDKAAKEIRRQMRKARIVDESTISEMEIKKKLEESEKKAEEEAKKVEETKKIEEIPREEKTEEVIEEKTPEETKPKEEKEEK